MNIIAYIVTNEIIAKQRRDNIFRKQSEYEPTSYETVRINLFSGVTVASKDLFFDEDDMKSETLRFLIAFCRVILENSFLQSALMPNMRVKRMFLGQI